MPLALKTKVVQINKRRIKIEVLKRCRSDLINSLHITFIFVRIITPRDNLYRNVMKIRITNWCMHQR